MSDKTGIEWTDATWNPIRGCSRMSDGCRNCYAEGVAARFNKPGQPYEGLAIRTTQGPKWTGRVMLVGDKLDEPIRMTKPRKIFVNSMSDLFHESVPFEFIDKVFAVMARARQHTFQVLTKRPERMLEYMNTADRHARVLRASYDVPLCSMADCAWPSRNVWLGVSVENQAAADERIPLLLQTPAAVRWISAEPLLSRIDVRRHIEIGHLDSELGLSNPGIDWVVAGGESGPKARPMHPDWARDLRDQCAAAGVPFLFKQFGEWAPADIKPGGSIGDEMRRGAVQLLHAPGNPEGFFRRGDAFVRRVGKKAAGRLLDGVQHDGYPA